MNLLQNIKTDLSDIIIKALNLAKGTGNLSFEQIPEFTVEAPKEKSHGDFAVNIAMLLARQAKKTSAIIAKTIVENISDLPDWVSGVETAGAGFINYTIDPFYFHSILPYAISEDISFGHSNYGNAEKIQIEFVSANPTGLLHIGNARGAALGDCLANILAAAGWDVTREYYINDSGNQIINFGKTLEARYLQAFGYDHPIPEDGYHGEDIKETVERIIQSENDRLLNIDSTDRIDYLTKAALKEKVDSIRHDLEEFGVKHDIWFSEQSLYDSGEIKETMDELNRLGLIQERDGALWFMATKFGDEKDEVVVRSNGISTYFAADIAYHKDKFKRGFKTVINIWGADHHGHVARLKGAMDAIGLSGDKLHIVLVQMVTVLIDGKPAKLSKRSGKAITLTTLLDDVPIDAARFFFNLREPKSQLEFDLDLAVKQSSDNPVYYVQYAHARICSILKGLTANGILLQKAFDYSYTSLVSPEEKALIRYLSYLPGEVDTAAREFNPARITRYTIELATLFHRFYTACRVKGEADEVMYPRIALCIATRQVLQNCLKMLKISAPESM
ncbi:MAG: arginine--tRNA ligase [Oscillospiraceae bacterium]|nr:arginine--tRNA ligase [Oscillospiraceae bacterium]